MGHTYNSLFFVTVAALLSPWLSIHGFRGFIPSVVLEIILGFLIGPHALGIATSTQGISFLATFGFSYLMFLSGIEMDFDLLFQKPKEGGRPPWLRGLVYFLITTAISFVVAFGLYRLHVTSHIWIITLLLSTTSVGIVTPALKEAGWISFDFGQETLLYALMADVFTLVFFTGYITLHTTGNAFSFLLIMVLLLFFVAVWRLLHLAQRLRLFHAVENATSEIGLRFAFALILAFLAFSESLGTEVVIGAFLAGAIVSLLSEKHSLLTNKLNSIGYGFLIPIFFVDVGLRFNFQSLAGTRNFVLAMIIFLVVMYVNKLLPSWILMRRFPVSQRIGSGFLLSSRLSLTIAASQIGEQTGLISHAMANGFILLSVTTCLVSPAAFTRILKKMPLPGIPETEKPPEKLQINSDTLPPGWVIDQIEVRSRMMDDIPMRILHLPQEVLFLSIIRGDERIIPRGHTHLEQFDVVQVMGEPDCISQIRYLFHGDISLHDACLKE
ncbi:cation:proton antiporter [Alicyclobacillus sp. SO9]|uniref:cation:proton antiporter n=1 Tax=Alicyclobacillus sp. SO9 TaxID=2665646 RepID=UPI0018E7CFA7|nr:cation:proton antiporter [Alicyclobacillus sp. SO9]QQE80153.1 cation:proton antiporter [Alicyclobacillus sp. SO9]